MLTRTGKLIYAMGRFGSSVLLSLVDLATFFLYADYFGLGGTLTGIAFAIGKLVIAFFGWYFGYLSDVTKSQRWGRRKPYVFAGSILLGLSTALLFLPDYFIPVGDQTLLFLYGTFFLGLANMSYGLLSTPYMAWLAEIADPEERVVVSAYQNTFSMLAQVVGTLLGFALPAMFLAGGSSLVLWVLLGLGGLEVLLYLPAVVTIREAERIIPRPNVRREIDMALGNKNYRYWLALQGLISMPTAILASLIMSYMQQVLMLSEIQFMMVGSLMLLVPFILFPIWTMISHRTGKKKPMVVSLLILTATLSLTIVVGQPLLGFIPLIYQGVLLISLIGIGISGWYLLPNPVTADIAHEDEISRGEARAGSYGGLISIPLNVLQSLARLIAGFIRDLPMVQGQTYSMGMLLWGPVSSVLLIPCIFLIAKYIETDPLRKEKK